MLPLDVAKLGFISVGVPEPVLDFDSKRPRTDAEGRSLFALTVVALSNAGAELMTIKVSGQPKGVSPGSPLKVLDLVATTWTMGDRHGISFKAASIEAIGPPATKASTPA